MYSERYQYALIALGVVAAAFFGVFFYRELFPEYRVYQNDYIALEKFRSTYTDEPPPAFKEGIKQIVFEREDKGPPLIDRCTSCHVAMQLPHFSPTKIELDVNGNIVRGVDGTPTQVPNENYIWKKLDQKIAELTDSQVLSHLKEEGQESKIAERLRESENLRSLKTARFGSQVYSVEKVLVMHPLIGKETRPFEFHPLDEYGCTSCHGGNGKGLTTDKAHGPVFDGQYETEYTGPKPEFLERDQNNDPIFARIFNHKPADVLLFQTTPILVGSLMQANCMQCHVRSAAVLQEVVNTTSELASKKKKWTDAIFKGYQNEVSALQSLWQLKQSISAKGLQSAIAKIKEQMNDFTVPSEEIKRLTAQLSFLSTGNETKSSQEKILTLINEQMASMIGSKPLLDALESKLAANPQDQKAVINEFIGSSYKSPGATGSLFLKWEAVNLEQSLLQHVEDTQSSFNQAVGDQQVISSIASDIDKLTENYHRGQQLYLSQACYACHRIAGVSRGGVGPELTKAASLYPWYLKEKIVWPQGSLRTSTMPNMHLDHIELQDLMSFLLAQNGHTKAVSETDYKIAVQEWEAGRKMNWEKPISPTQVHNLDYAMTVFATEGCAGCHRLKGFESNVGFSIEQQAKKPDFEKLYQEHEWFQKLFPEDISGTGIVAAIDAHAQEIDQHIADDVRQGSLLEEIEQKHPNIVEAFYPAFRYAARAKNNFYQNLISKKILQQDQKMEFTQKLDEWKQRVHRVLMMFVQEYGLGRLIGPRPNWSGVFRSDQWLMEHFRNPSAHVAKSIMPIFPFDDTKFYALTYMLDVLGRRNRDAVQAIWEHRGFNPSLAFQTYCAQCHGEYLQGNGPVSDWIYPIPKNLRSADFLRNLTEANAILSITHGVKGTPMPPWGEIPPDKEKTGGPPVLRKDEIKMLVEWIFGSLPGGTVIRTSQDVPKWLYSPKDVINELRREGGQLKEKPKAQEENHESLKIYPSNNLSQDMIELADLMPMPATPYYASLKPIPSSGVQKDSQDEITKIFEVLPNPIPEETRPAYYIKRKYYTEENLQQGKMFFEANCAVCHGKEADGSGDRSSVMFEAKPRMLTNLAWLKSRDDLRLLRSIKYGVPGTAMTPWGDLTSSLQRLQLAMFIRSLSSDTELLNELSDAAYISFDASSNQIELARIAGYSSLQSLEEQLDKVRQKQRAAFDKSMSSQEAADEALGFYREQMALSSKVKQQKDLDDLLNVLKKNIKKQGDLNREIGMDLNRAEVDSENWKLFIHLASDEQSFSFEDNRLILKENAQIKQQASKSVQQIAKGIDEKINSFKRSESAAKGKIASAEQQQAIHELNARISTLEKAKRKLLSGFEEINNLQRESSEIYQEYLKKNK